MNTETNKTSEYLIDRKNVEIENLKKTIADMDYNHDLDMRMVYVAEFVLFLFGVGVGAFLTTILK